MSSGVLGARLLKTTQSGYEGFSETNTRGCQTRGIESWRRRWTPSGRTSATRTPTGSIPDELYAKITRALTELFYGPPRGA